MRPSLFIRPSLRSLTTIARTPALTPARTPPLFERLVAETVDDVDVDHADGLHEGVTDCRSDKFEAALFEIFAHRIGFPSLRGDLLHRLRRVDARLAADELPDVAIEAAELFLHAEKCFRVSDGRSDFEFVTHDAGIAQ